MNLVIHFPKQNLFKKTILKVYNRVIEFQFTPTKQISIQLLVISNLVFSLSNGRDSYNESTSCIIALTQSAQSSRSTKFFTSSDVLQPELFM